MKRLITLFLLITLTVASFNVFVNAKQEEKIQDQAEDETNLCQTFAWLVDFQSGILMTRFSPFDLYTMMRWTCTYMTDFWYEYGDPKVNEDGFYQECRVPADLLDEYVNRYFALDDEVRTLVLEEMKKYQDNDNQGWIKYYEESNEYALFFGGAGGPRSYHYTLIGYIKHPDHHYSVYIEKKPYLCNSLEQLCSLTGVDPEDNRIRINESGQYYVEIPEDQRENIEMLVAYNGEDVRIITSQLIERFPDSSQMIVCDHPEEQRWLMVDEEPGYYHHGVGHYVCEICGETVKEDVDIVPMPLTDAYEDVEAGAWYEPGVAMMTDLGIMTGKSDRIFAPNNTMLRSEMAQVVYKMFADPNEDLNDVKLPFTDVSENHWAINAMKWCYKYQVVSGVTETTFAPDAPILREEFISMLYRYMVSTMTEEEYQELAAGIDTAILEQFPDGAEIDDYAVEAMQAFVQAGIITGSDGMLGARDVCTRGQIALIVRNLTVSKFDWCLPLGKTICKI